MAYLTLNPMKFNDLHRAILGRKLVLVPLVVVHHHRVETTIALLAPNKGAFSVFVRDTPAIIRSFYTGITSNALGALVDDADHTFTGASLYKRSDGRILPSTGRVKTSPFLTFSTGSLLMRNSETVS